ncbi:HD-GYP domain-containing protein [Streptomonospora nanhaiensis]|uniref:Putative nucleotidyltransferase with HDIG domain n=1 Tax=Streptomonospora nanhaiensis TaxID=1323731 RepID=A0A853BST2_9ACTN|nr:HD-GYP domain-containing protein [Streptomonospora nanhaiensis]MBV2362697.1 HD-GYP domain-containing protein [Streptomonospora nanhaiensis]MBX9389155.1 HD-GYP domain-containing protein [Streptomonospora nanhaiensis]NYI97954.1 putative nucleotidyltransferase with HDIG domain [Streptomonospora nanhaiensis]
MALGPYEGIDPATLVLLIILMVVAETIGTTIDTGRAGISPSVSVSLAAIVLVGPVGVAVATFFSTPFILRRQNFVKRLFNGGQYALAGYAAGHVYLALGGELGPPQHDDFPWALVPFCAALLVHSAINGALMGGLMWYLGVVHLRRPHRIRWRTLATLELASLGYGMLGLFIAAIWGVVGALAILLVLLPLFIARWAFDQCVAEQRAHEATLATLCQAVETKDYYTRGHCMRVAKASAMIAQELGMHAERVQTIRYAGMLHDVGKLGVPTKVLQKPGKLTEEEYAAIQLHPMRGYEIVREIGFLDEALAGIMHHHERMDGRGYPMGLAGHDIPEFARIISVADAFDCMTSTRSYRKARSIEEAIDELRRGAGPQFDPTMVDALIAAVGEQGWESPDIVEPPSDDESAEVASQDHDDPSVPLRVAGEAE